jgi:ethanolamine ammonia-lyase large subunit
MARYAAPVGGTRYVFADLREVMAKATPPKAGDRLAGVAATSAQERVAARTVLADVPLARFLEEPLVPYDEDDVTRLILDGHDPAAFAPVARLTVGELREWLLAYETGPETLAAVAPGLTPEMAAAVSKLMRNQDLVLAARKCRVTTRFRSTVGLPGRLSVRLQPNHPTDDPAGVAAAILDGLLYGCGDAVVGINPASDSVAAVERLLGLTAELIARHAVPTQSCVLAHVTTTLRVLERGAPVDLVFQSVGGTEGTNRSFGFTLAQLAEARDAARALRRGAQDGRVMYFETGQGSALSAGAAHGLDQQTCEARAYAVCRAFEPFLVNTVVGFIGPEYLHDGKEIVRAGLEDHFCGKLLGLPMGVDVCHTNHAQADQDDMDVLLTLLGAAGCSYVMGVPGADDVMLGYQSTSFHDAQYLRQVLGLRPAPEFERWLVEAGVMDAELRLRPVDRRHRLLGAGGGAPGGEGAPEPLPDPAAATIPGRTCARTRRRASRSAALAARSRPASSSPSPLPTRPRRTRCGRRSTWTSPPAPSRPSACR